MDQGNGEAHDQVVTSLLDLQARLRGETPAPVAAPTATATAPEAPHEDSVVVIPEAEEPVLGSIEGAQRADSDVQVLVTPDPEGAAERDGFAPVTTLPGALGAEDRLSVLADRLAALEAGLRGVVDRVEKASADRASRIERFEGSVLGELAEQRTAMVDVMTGRFERMESELRDAIRTAAFTDTSPVAPSDVDADDDEPA